MRYHLIRARCRWNHLHLFNPNGRPETRRGSVSQEDKNLEEGMCELMEHCKRIHEEQRGIASDLDKIILEAKFRALKKFWEEMERKAHKEVYLLLTGNPPLELFDPEPFNNGEVA